MIVRTLEEVIGTKNEVKADTWASRRLLLKDDNMGFSYHDTIIYAGTETHIWYKNHLEAVYCVGGEGEIETVSDGKVYPIKDGTMYALDKNDEHYLRATKDMRMICVFNPPLTGRETHDKDGVYPLVED
ncbi:ectoine synthase [Siminovitchia fortis]|uniref:L-ectoine synthase n=2 Tax=Bacillales TaxID=1385 RepID=A0A443INC9_9BACI|nr:ectoine synthase [Siminovitchia fortis]RWR07310.1 ectoine synthase [Siminovitchia fortis]WHY81533.1 ectoine synthase [Siminovitchia fortis]